MFPRGSVIIETQRFSVFRENLLLLLHGVGGTPNGRFAPDTADNDDELPFFLTVSIHPFFMSVENGRARETNASSASEQESESDAQNERKTCH